MHEQPQAQPHRTWYADPQALCWMTAMILVLLTPLGLLFDVALWRVALAVLCELAALAALGWLRNGR